MDDEYFLAVFRKKTQRELARMSPKKEYKETCKVFWPETKQKFTAPLG